MRTRAELRTPHFERRISIRKTNKARINDQSPPPDPYQGMGMPSNMATWTIVGNFDARSGLGRFETQLFAPSVQAAVRRVMSGKIIRQKLYNAPDGWPKRFTIGEIGSLLSIDRLPNVYLCQLAQYGNYLTLSILRTAGIGKSTHTVRRRAHKKSSAPHNREVRALREWRMPHPDTEDQ